MNKSIRGKVSEQFGDIFAVSQYYLIFYGREWTSKRCPVPASSLPAERAVFFAAEKYAPEQGRGDIHLRKIYLSEKCI